MDYKNSRIVGDDCIRIPFNCDQGFEEYYLVYVGKTPYEHERHLDKVVCSRGPLTPEEHLKCIKTPKDVCWKDQDPAYQKDQDKLKTVNRSSTRAKTSGRAKS